MQPHFINTASAQGLVAPMENTQTVALLESNLSPLLTNESRVASIQTVDESAISAYSNMVVSDGIDESSYTTDDVSLYIVKTGDTVQEIADMFDVSSTTILSANGLKRGDKLTVGETILILPVDGVSYKVAKGDTISSIANKFKIPADDIKSFNQLDGSIAIGDELVIPGAKPLVEVPKKVVKKVVKGSAHLPGSLASGTGKDVTGYFIRPVPCPITQGKHDKYAVDLGCPTGTPIKAAAAGTIVFSRNGYNGGFGNLEIIQHDNGTQTFYAHMSRRGAEVGDTVAQGQVIGYVGSTGHSTGPHLHWEVRGGLNPLFGHSKGSTDF